MSLYCTLQEAYNVPSFDASGKKKRACYVQAKASADAFDPYHPENGRGEKAAVETFQVGKTMSQEESPVTYKGKANDYEYYRKQYGVQLPTIEGFQNEQNAPTRQQCGSPAPMVYKIPVSDEAKEMYEQAMSTTLDENVPKYVPEVPEARKVDMSKVSGYYDEELEQYLQTKDMKSAPFSEKRLPAVKKVPDTQEQQDEYRQYIPYDTSLIKGSDKREILRDEEAPPERRTDDTRRQEPCPKTIISDDSWKNFWDIFMFVFAGILVMFLCEQLFKLALMIGMKRTVDILEPYLK